MWSFDYSYQVSSLYCSTSSDGQRGKDKIFIFLLFSRKISYCNKLYFKEEDVLKGLHVVPQVIMGHYAVGPVGLLRGYPSMQSHLERCWKIYRSLWARLGSRD